MKLDAYNGKHLQHFMSLLATFEGEGVTDVRVMRQRVDSALREKFKRQTPAIPRNKKINRHKTCPSCGKGLMLPVLNQEDINILGCKRCRYSEVVA